MLMAAAVAMLAHSGLFGELARAMSSFIAFGAAFAARPARGAHPRPLLHRPRRATGRRRHFAALRDLRKHLRTRRYGALPGLWRHDLLAVLLARLALPRSLQAARALRVAGRPRAASRAAGRAARSSPLRLVHYASLVLAMLAVLSSVLYLIWAQSATSMRAAGPSIAHALSGSFLKIFLALSLVGCIAAWWLCWSAKAAASRRKSRSGKPNC
jgi:hypothetical protein